MNPSPRTVSEDFVDPSNFSEILERLKNCETRKETTDLINEVFPLWLVGEMKMYSDDYPHLQRNWKAICDMNNVEMQSIVLVQDVAFKNDKTHSLLYAFCEHMTKKGYIVRRVGEMQPCRKCNKAIPCVDVWHLMKEKHMPVPKEWMDVCRKCL